MVEILIKCEVSSEKINNEVILEVLKSWIKSITTEEIESTIKKLSTEMAFEPKKGLY